MSLPPGISPELGALARRFGVAVRYRDADRTPHDVPPATVVEVLARLGVDASTEAAARAALAREVDQRTRRLLPSGTVATRTGRTTTLSLPCPPELPPSAVVRTESGDEVVCPVHVAPGGGAHVVVPPLPAGWHELTARHGDETGTAVVVTAPERIPWPATAERVWGWAVQLYALRGRTSWELGDYADLADLVSWSGRELGAGVVVCNPLHAPAPVLPFENSPYYPSSRLFHSPLYLRPEATAEYADAPGTVRAAVDALRPAAPGELIDRDRAWAAKARALEILFTEACPPARRARLAEFRAARGSGLEDFALYCALAELHGRRWPGWPAELHRPDTAAAGTARARLRPRVDFHAWLQLLCAEQLQAAGVAARAAGMAVGIVHDVAVGADPEGADAWTQPGLLVPGMSVGAPPDGFNQLGQDWGLPPWNPLRLDQTGYRPFRDLLRAGLHGAGGLRVDHVLGLFRLWWIPAGRGAADGTYVEYDHQALLAVLALEAARAGAVVVGEDLGTIQPHVAAALAEHGVLGSDVLWFARDADDPARLRRPARWRREAAASVTTHDLPTAAGFVTGEHVRLRAGLGLLGRPEAAEAAHAAAERAALRDLLELEGLIPPGAEPPLEELVLALHALLGRTPSRILLATPGDALGDLRQPNLPGTDRYPNWCLPLARPDGGHAVAVDLEDFMASPRVHRFVASLRAAMAGPEPAEPASEIGSEVDPVGEVPAARADQFEVVREDAMQPAPPDLGDGIR